MSKITRDDIQRIGDEETLMHFLKEKLNLPVPEKAILAQVALPLPLLFLGLDNAVTEQIVDCQDFSGLPQDALGERRPFLIRFRREQDYSEILRKVAEGLSQRNINPVEIFFMCVGENFQPFAIAYFNDSESENWQDAVLNVLAWTQENTHIHTSAKHELPVDFFPNASTSQAVGSTSPGALLAKLVGTGTPLGRSEGVNIRGGLPTGHHKAFVINEHIREQLRAKDPKSIKLIKRIPKLNGKWMCESAHLIWLQSSKNKQWRWSGERKKLEAERIFKTTYPAISKHLRSYKDKLKARKIPVEFYWEFPASNLYSMLKDPKIIYPATGTSMQAVYDRLEGLPLAPAYFIPTTDLSLLAILNSKLFTWYARKKYWHPIFKRIVFSRQNMEKAPIASRTEKQKVELSNLVQQILNTPNSPEVSGIEKDIDQLIYKLYKLTEAEIELIEEESNQ